MNESLYPFAQREPASFPALFCLQFLIANCKRPKLETRVVKHCTLVSTLPKPFIVALQIQIYRPPTDCKLLFRLRSCVLRTRLASHQITLWILSHCRSCWSVPRVRICHIHQEVHATTEVTAVMTICFSHTYIRTYIHTHTYTQTQTHVHTQ